MRNYPRHNFFIIYSYVYVFLEDNWVIDNWIKKYPDFSTDNWVDALPSNYNKFAAARC